MADYLSEEQAKLDICEIGRRMYQRGYVAANDGNISIRIGNNEIWTTPTGVSKGFMTPDMLVKVDLSGNIVEGKLKPSSELKMHLKVYEDRKDVRAVTHAHPPAATSYAVAGIPLENALMPEFIVNLGSVPLAGYATPSTREVPDSISEFTAGYNAVLLSNHGVLTWGDDVYQAFYRMETLEHYSMINIYTKIIGKVNEIPSDKMDALIDLRDKMGIKFGSKKD